MNIIRKTKRAKTTHPQDCNSVAKRLSESKVGGGYSPQGDDNYDGIEWNSKKEK